MALLVAVMAMMLMLALGAGVALTTMTETSIAANHRDGLQALYAAEAGIDVAISQLRTMPDWRAVADAGGPFVVGSFADVLQTPSTTAPVSLEVSISADPGGDTDMLVLQSRASGPGTIQRTVQVTIRRVPTAVEGAAPTITTLAWR